MARMEVSVAGDSAQEARAKPRTTARIVINLFMARN
jgi:hypothetical protein